jgi:hypothetical protein
MPTFKKQSVKRRGKYNVAPKAQRTYKGKVYDSKLEKEYRGKLELLKKATTEKNRVVDIQEQVPYEFVINGTKVCTYLLDFKVTYADGRIEHIDVKGILTDVYRIKRKLLLACYGIKIKEIKKGDF